jgi:hypothetical protein
MKDTLQLERDHDCEEKSDNDSVRLSRCARFTNTLNLSPLAHYFGSLLSLFLLL